MNKFYETVINNTGDIQPGKRAGVLDSSGSVVTLYADAGGTRFTDDAGTNVDYATVAQSGLVEFYWTAADGQTLQIRDESDNVELSVTDFADNWILDNMGGALDQSSITDLEDDLAARPTSTTLAATGGADLIGAADGETVQDHIDYSQEKTSPENHGADGVDDTTATQNAFDNATEARPFHTYRGERYEIKSPLDLTGEDVVNVDGELYISGTGAVTIGRGSTTNNGVYNLYSVTDGGSYSGTAPSSPLLTFTGMKAATVNIGRCRGMEILSDGTDTANNSTAYCTFNLNYVPNLTLKSVNNGSPQDAWINENRFYGGRMDELRLQGGYGHNHNHFLDNSFEGSDVVIEFGVTADGGGNVNNNWIRRARFENADSGSIEFGPDTFNNVVMCSHTEFDLSVLKTPNIGITDESGLNTVLYEHETLYDKILIAEFDPASLLSDGTTTASTNNTCGVVDPQHGSNSARVAPGITRSSIGSGSLENLCESDVIPVFKGLQGIFLQDMPQNSLRFRISLWDEDMKPITSEGGGGEYVEATWIGSLDSDGYYSAGADHDKDTEYDFAFIRDEVAYAQFHIAISSDTPTPIGRQQIFIIEHPQHRRQTTRTKMHRPKVGLLAAEPNQGTAPPGTFVLKDDGTAQWVCVYQHRTTLNGAVASSGTSATINSRNGASNGDVVGIQLDDGGTHWSAASGFSSLTLTVDALPSDAADGNAVVFCRWVEIS